MDLRSAKSALRTARLEIWGEYPAYPKRSQVAPSIAGYVEKVFTRDAQVAASIVQSFSLLVGTGAVVEDVRQLLLRLTIVQEDIVNDVLLHALGWVTEQITCAVEQDKPANLSVDTFRNDLRAFIRRHDSKLILRSLAPGPSREGIESELAVRRYVRQLRMVDCDEEMVIEAVTDYLKAASDRTQWAAQGHIDDVVLDAYELKLMETWRNVRRRSAIVNSHLELCKRGQLVLLECTGQHLHLDATEVPSHFCRGSFHTLADRPVLGWHPNYEALIDVQERN